LYCDTLFNTKCCQVASNNNKLCGKTGQDKILNYNIRERERVDVAPIVEKMVETILSWFGHVKRRHVDSVRVNQMEGSQIDRGRGRRRKTIRETIEKDLEINSLDSNIVFDGTLWLRLIHVANPT